MGHARTLMERIPHTCPAIDAAIRAVVDAYKLADSARKDMEPETLLEILSDIEFGLRGVEDDLEKLRDANDNLRGEAINALEMCDELERGLHKEPTP